MNIFEIEERAMLQCDDSEIYGMGRIDMNSDMPMIGGISDNM